MLNVLLIDDNINDRLLAICSLKKEFADLQIAEIKNPQELAQALENGVFDVVVTDESDFFRGRWATIKQGT